MTDSEPIIVKNTDNAGVFLSNSKDITPEAIDPSWKFAASNFTSKKLPFE